MNTLPIDQITLRDYFAAAALAGLLADGDRRSAVENAYAIADKMLLERDDDPAGVPITRCQRLVWLVD